MRSTARQNYGNSLRMKKLAIFAVLAGGAFLDSRAESVGLAYGITLEADTATVEGQFLLLQTADGNLRLPKARLDAAARRKHFGDPLPPPPPPPPKATPAPPPPRALSTPIPKATPDPVSGLLPLREPLPLLSISKRALEASGKPAPLAELVKEVTPSSLPKLKASIFYHVLLHTREDSLSTKPTADISYVAQSELTYRFNEVRDNPTAYYQHLGRCLLIADYLLSRPEPAWRLRGASLALELTEIARAEVVKDDAALRLAICDCYVLPNLGLFPQKDPKYHTIPGLEDSLLQWEYLNVIFELSKCYANDKAPRPKLTTIYKLLLQAAKLDNPNWANFARLKLSNLAEASGDYEKALSYLKEHDPKGGTGGNLTLIPKLEEKIKKEKSQNK